MKSFFIMSIISILLGVGAAVTYTTYVQPPAQAPAANAGAQEPPPTPAEQAAAAAPAKFGRKFQEVLDEFLKNVDTKAIEYKNRRRVIVDLVRPENLGDPAYVQENQQMMESLIPELKTKMDDIMAEFSRAETEIRGTIAEQPPEKQQSILNQWRSVRDKQASHFLTFFASEQGILLAYQEMMQFYKDRQGAYVYDVSTNSLLFTNPADKPLEQELRERIKELESKQMDAIRRATGADDEPQIPAVVESNMPVATPVQ